MPKRLTPVQYLERADVDAPERRFRGHLAVPWLARELAVCGNV